MTLIYTYEERQLARKMLSDHMRKRVAETSAVQARKVGLRHLRAKTLDLPPIVLPEDLLHRIDVHDIQTRRSNHTHCKSCDCPIDEFTVGCDTCQGRHYYRARRLQARRSQRARLL